MYKRILAATAIAAAMAFSPVPASAQAQNGLVNVNVNVSDVSVDLNRIISDNNINAQIPVSAIVSVPIGIAANVCNVSAAVLAQQAAGAAPCDATNQTASHNELMQLARAMARQQR